MKGIIITAALLLMLALAGTADYSDAQSMSSNYRDNVCAGIWPDYKEQGVQCE